MSRFLYEVWQIAFLCQLSNLDIQNKVYNIVFL